MFSLDAIGLLARRVTTNGPVIEQDKTGSYVVRLGRAPEVPKPETPAPVRKAVDAWRAAVDAVVHAGADLADAVRAADTLETRARAEGNPLRRERDAAAERVRRAKRALEDAELARDARAREAWQAAREATVAARPSLAAHGEARRTFCDRLDAAIATLQELRERVPDVGTEFNGGTHAREVAFHLERTLLGAGLEPPLPASSSPSRAAPTTFRGQSAPPPEDPARDAREAADRAKVGSAAPSMFPSWGG